MVRFEEDRLVIEIPTYGGGRPAAVEKWQEVTQALCDVVRWIKADTIHDDTFFEVIDLIGCMTPDWEVAKKMVD